MSIYNPGGILDKEPVAIKAALVAVAAAVVITVPDLNLSGEAVAAWGIAAELVLGLFVRSKSTPNVTAEVMVEQVAAETEVRVKSEVDAYLTAVSADRDAAEADQSHDRYAAALADAEAEIRSLRAQVDAKSAKKPTKKAAAKT
jgi:hypothetical protein